MIKFLLMNLIVGASSFLITYKSFRIRNFIDSLILWFLAYFAQVISTQMLLGIFGSLYLRNVMLLNFAILLLIAVFTKEKDSSFSFIGAKDSLRQILESKIASFAVSLVLGFVIVKLFFNLINPPFGWDSLNYHYTFPVEWIKSGLLNNPLVVSDDPFPAYYPINGSLFFLWMIFPFKSAFLADLGQFPFFVISFLGIFSICRKLKLDKEYSFFCAILFVIIPNFFKQLQIGYVDIMVAGVFIAGLNFLLSLREDFTIKNTVFFALAAGIFIGIKTTCLPYSLFLALPFLYLLFANKKYPFRRKFTCLSLFTFFILILGCFSYLRNLALTGNPFYPLEVSILGYPVFKGVIDKATFIARREAGGDSLTKLLFHEGLGIQSALIILPATLSAFFISLLKNKDRDMFRNYLMLLPLLLFLTYRHVLPLPNSRYLYPMLAVGICAGFCTLHSLKLSLKAIRVTASIFILASVFDCARRIELGISFAASLLFFVILGSILKNEKLGDILFSKRFIFITAIFTLIIMKLLFLDYQKNEYARYIKNSRFWPDATKAWAWLNDNTKCNNIAYVGRPVPFPLYGTSFKNNVYYASVNSHDPVNLHDLRNSKYRWDSAENMHKNFEDPGNYRGGANYNLWIENLKRRKADLLFIYSLHHTKDIAFPVEERWSKSNPGQFSLLFSNDTIRIYRIN